MWTRKISPASGDWVLLLCHPVQRNLMVQNSSQIPNQGIIQVRPDQETGATGLCADVGLGCIPTSTFIKPGLYLT